MPFDPTEPQLEATEVETTVEQTIEENEIAVFIKGTQQMPQCGYSKTALSLIRHYRSDDAISVVNVLDNLDAFREELEDYSGWTTIPQVFVDGEFIGGSDILVQLNEQADLAEKLNTTDDIEPLELKSGSETTQDVTDGPF